MNAIYVLLFLGAFVPFAVITILALGSLIHLTSLAKEALRAMGKAFASEAEASPRKPAAPFGHASNAVRSESSVRGDVAYAVA